MKIISEIAKGIPCVCKKTKGIFSLKSVYYCIVHTVVAHTYTMLMPICVEKKCYKITSAVGPPESLMFYTESETV